MSETATRTSDEVQRLAVILALWSLAYACYRTYYAAGGELGMFGHPISSARWRAINAAGAAIVLLAAIVPLAALRVRAVRQLPLSIFGRAPDIAERHEYFPWQRSH